MLSTQGWPWEPGKYLPGGSVIMFWFCLFRTSALDTALWSFLVPGGSPEGTGCSRQWHSALSCHACAAWTTRSPQPACEDLDAQLNPSGRTRSSASASRESSGKSSAKSAQCGKRPQKCGAAVPPGGRARSRGLDLPQAWSRPAQASLEL